MLNERTKRSFPALRKHVLDAIEKNMMIHVWKDDK